MSDDTNAAAPNEVIIVRRKGGDGDGGHHGGAWKIAYADFMTALMALFLVMWLVNAASDDMKAQVATYFNPMKLSDPTYVPKGVASMETDQSGKESHKGSTKKSSSESKKERSDAKMAPETFSKSLQNPFELVPDRDNKKDKGRGHVDPKAEFRALPGPATEQGDAYRDPFDPDYRSVSENDSTDGEFGMQFDDEGKGVEIGKVAPGPSDDRNREKSYAQADMSAEQELAIETELEEGGYEADQAARQQKTIGELAAENALAEKKAKEKREQEAKVEAQDIAKELDEVLQGVHIDELPNITVIPEEDGVLISLTDNSDFGMFSIASADPNPDLIVLMRRVAELLVKREGNIVVRGHTDGRPFRSVGNDNWRLSMARAHSAYAMLLQSGIEKARFERIEGYADQKLKIPEDPEASQNRRIEIFLRKDDT